MDPAFFFEMPALDMQRAKGFYERAFGWRILTSYENFYFALTTESDAARNPQTLGPINGAIQRKDETMGALRLLIGVEDLDVAIKKALDEGGRIKLPPKKIPGYYYAVVFDTEGNEVNVVQRLA
jgi:predicted enzyme related to lactoylglutathione lyase